LDGAIKLENRTCPTIPRSSTATSEIAIWPPAPQFVGQHGFKRPRERFFDNFMDRPMSAGSSARIIIRNNHVFEDYDLANAAGSRNKLPEEAAFR
jgi:hypothetical protein